MRLFLKIIAILAISIAAILIFAKITISFFNQESPSNERTFSVKKQTSLKNLIFLTLDSEENIKLANKINFLILGNPGQGNNAPLLTDTIMMASLKPADKKIYFFSIPRDLYVRINPPAGRQSFTKINSLYEIGLKQNKNSPADYIVEAAEKITGQKIDYFLTIDLDAIKKIVDDLGGLNVNVSETVNDPKFPTASNGYETFYIEKGWRYFSGELASKYLRTRHSPNSDFDRMRRQQDIVEAFRKKIFGLNLFWDFPKLLKTYSNLESHIATNIDISEMKPIYRAVKEIPAENLIYKVLDTDRESGLMTTANMLLKNGIIASIVQPRAGLENYEEIQGFIKNTIQE